MFYVTFDVMLLTILITKTVQLVSSKLISYKFTTCNRSTGQNGQFVCNGVSWEKVLQLTIVKYGQLGKV